MDDDGFGEKYIMIMLKSYYTCSQKQSISVFILMYKLEVAVRFDRSIV